MGERSTFVGMDVHVADGGRDGEVRHYGVIGGDLESLRQDRAAARIASSSGPGT